MPVGRVDTWAHKMGDRNKAWHRLRSRFKVLLPPYRSVINALNEQETKNGPRKRCYTEFSWKNTIFLPIWENSQDSAHFRNRFTRCQVEYRIAKILWKKPRSGNAHIYARAQPELNEYTFGSRLRRLNESSVLKPKLGKLSCLTFAYQN